jgi:hypothetical protein
MNERKQADVRVRYHGEEYRVVLGPPYFVEQANGALMGSGMPTIELADAETGELRHGLTVEIFEAPLKPGQVLVGGRDEGLGALTEAGVVRFTGRYYCSGKFNATFAICELLLTAPCQEREQMTPSRGQPVPEPTNKQNRGQPAAQQERQRPVCELLAGDFSFQVFEAPAEPPVTGRAYDVQVHYKGGDILEPCGVDDFIAFTYVDYQHPVAVYQVFAERDIVISFERACDFSRGAKAACFLLDALQKGRSLREWWEAGGKDRQVVLKQGEQSLVPEADNSPELG